MLRLSPSTVSAASIRIGSSKPSSSVLWRKTPSGSSRTAFSMLLRDCMMMYCPISSISSNPNSSMIPHSRRAPSSLQFIIA